MKPDLCKVQKVGYNQMMQSNYYQLYLSRQDEYNEKIHDLFTFTKFRKSRVMEPRNRPHEASAIAFKFSKCDFTLSNAFARPNFWILHNSEGNFSYFTRGIKKMYIFNVFLSECRAKSMCLNFTLRNSTRLIQCIFHFYHLLKISKHNLITFIFTCKTFALVNL